MEELAAIRRHLETEGLDWPAIMHASVKIHCRTTYWHLDPVCAPVMASALYDAPLPVDRMSISMTYAPLGGLVRAGRELGLQPCPHCVDIPRLEQAATLPGTTLQEVCVAARTAATLLAEPLVGTDLAALAARRRWLVRAREILEPLFPAAHYGPIFIALTARVNEVTQGLEVSLAARTAAEATDANWVLIHLGPRSGGNDSLPDILLAWTDHEGELLCLPASLAIPIINAAAAANLTATAVPCISPLASLIAATLLDCGLTPASALAVAAAATT